MRRIVFHIGMPKCGTSTIQNFAYKNLDLLESKGCYYPTFSKYESLYPNRRHVSTGNANPLVYAVLSESKIIEHTEHFKLKNIIDEFIELFISVDADTILLSHEDFVSLSPKIMNLVIDSFRNNNFNVEAILYVRHQVDWLASDYQQCIKQLHSSDDIYTHVGKRLAACNYLNHCNRWTSLVGKDNLIVRLLSKETIENNLVYDFFKTIKINTDGFHDLKLDNINEGLGVTSINILPLINSLNISSGAYKELYVATTKLDVLNQMPKYVLPDDLKKLVTSYFKNHNIEFGEKYLTESDYSCLMKI